MLIVAVKATMPGAIPPIDISIAVVTWSGLGAQGVKGQDKAHRQDNAQPSFQVHSLALQKRIYKWDLLI
jgi:hypothetical protein